MAVNQEDPLQKNDLETEAKKQQVVELRQKLNGFAAGRVKEVAQNPYLDAQSQSRTPSPTFLSGNPTFMGLGGTETKPKMSEDFDKPIIRPLQEGVPKAKDLIVSDDEM